ncbi:uncharacterized protein PRCAT00002220001 [Priceomyces carsonii]|uniref:uncharacterized protein n=1 Tax=Priceomyces carsonii TaxID=28549 RepID=UPI002ED7A1B9|nr:unnamed protein product [Priceomyces carsonii]
MSLKVLKDWYYKQSNTKKWYPANSDTYGNQIHTDLLFNKQIRDPFVDDNEIDVQWVGKVDWDYKTNFEASDVNKRHELVFNGLDTFATVYLNGKEILQSDNMFRIFKVDVKLEEQNQLLIKFKSGLNESRKIEKINGSLYCSNGETSRLHARKAQYHYGWDWGPLLMTCGPWRPVELVEYDLGKIEDFYINYDVKSLSNVNIRFELSIEQNSTDMELEVKIISPQGKLIEVVKSMARPKSTIHFNLQTPSLWYPKSYGEQSLYQFIATLSHKDNILHVVKKSVGLRKVELIEESIEEDSGSSFYFRINDVPIFCQGSNWIPSHSFSSSLTSDDYRKWVQLVDDGNQNMLRIWGGGIYEHDSLYEECDRRGILIWHDFMFACGIYPAYPSFVENVKKELCDQLKRLRNYCSIIVYAGNNEDYQVAESIKQTEFPARLLYEDVFPTLVKQFTNVAYRFGCPYSSPHIRTDDPKIGDIHQWNVWHGTQEKYQDWDKLVGRFVSEFGMLAFPNAKSLTKCITVESQLYPQLRLMDHHNKSDGFERRLALYVMENFRVKSMALKEWIYLTQIMQLECLAYAYRLWKREWGQQNKRKCGGAIVWQTNDCWPVTSWSIIDYYKVPKLAYYAIKRECEEITVGLKRFSKRIADPDEPEDLSKQTPYHDYARKVYQVDLWGTNSTLKTFEGYVKMQIFSTEKLIKEFPLKKITLNANQVTELMSEPLSLDDIVFVQLFNENQEVIYRASDWPQPLKYLIWSDKTSILYRLDGSNLVLLTNKPLKGVEILVEEPGIVQDNSIDLFPGDSYSVKVNNVTPDHKIEFNYLSN